MATSKQARAKRLSMSERAEQQLELHFPNYEKQWLWKRKVNDGYTTVPRTLPLVMQAIDAASKGHPAGHTLFCLWARSPDHPLLVIENPTTFAAEAGFSGERIVDTWRRRMKRLQELHFIDVKKGDAGDFNYVLLLNPNVAMEHMHQQGLVQTNLYSRFLIRATDVGAYSEIDDIQAHWDMLREEAVCAATVSGAELGSTALRFEPAAVSAGEHSFAIGTAGSCMLVLQTVLPALMLADGSSCLKLSGGTHNPMAPTYHFIERVFAPLLQRMGVRLEMSLRRHGFYPAGGGEVEIKVHPAPEGLKPLALLVRGASQAAYAESLIAGLPRRIAERELEVLAQALGWSVEQCQVPALRQNEGPGNELQATLTYEHVSEMFTTFGEKAVSSDQVARKLAKEVSAYLGSSAPVGPHLADQLALPMALAVHRSGQSGSYLCSEMTEHAWTNIDVIKRFLPVEMPVQAHEGGWMVDVRPGAS